MDYKEHIRKKDGGLQAILSYKEGSKWKQKSKQGFEDSKKGEKKAKQWMHEILNELENNMCLNTEYKKITFKDFYNIYISDRKDILTDATLDTIESSYLKFVDLSEICMSDIKTIDIQRCVNSMIKEGYKSSTIQRYLSNMKALFNQAINKYNILSINPVKNIEYSKTESNPKIALTTRQLDDLLNKLKNDSYQDKYIISLIAAKCGLRLAEILGLTWNDIDFQNKIINVNKQWKTKNGIYTFTRLKTNTSYRNVFFNNYVKKELLEFKNKNPINIDSRIFNYKTKSLSSALRTKYVHYGYNISVHELRHTYATNLISNGIDFKTAAQLLGHNIEETMRTYSHVNDDMLNYAKTIIDKI